MNYRFHWRFEDTLCEEQCAGGVCRGRGWVVTSRNICRMWLLVRALEGPLLMRHSSCGHPIWVISTRGMAWRLSGIRPLPEVIWFNDTLSSNQSFWVTYMVSEMYMIRYMYCIESFECFLNAQLQVWNQAFDMLIWPVLEMYLLTGVIAWSLNGVP